jgi:probable rRNA maturation factor
MTARRRTAAAAPYNIAVTDECRILPVDPASLQRAVEWTLVRHACESAALSVVLVDDARIAALNKQYLGHAGPTDVLSFNLGGEGPVVDGEVIVSVETARRQSASRGHTAEAEILLYVVHGTLHLLGFDDRTREDAQAMHEEEDRILKELGVGSVYHSEAR